MTIIENDAFDFFLILNKLNFWNLSIIENEAIKFTDIIILPFIAVLCKILFNYYNRQI